MKRKLLLPLLLITTLSTQAQNYSELRWAGSTPYIDFSNDATIDYDVRLILTGDNSLDIEGGNVGIGTSTPSGLLHLKDGAFWSAYNYGANLVIDGSHHNAIAFLDAGSSNPFALANVNGKFTISKMPSLGDVETSPNELLSIQGNGNIGVGNTNPQTPIDVTGNLTLRNMNNAGHGGSSLHFTSYDYNHPGPLIKSDLSTANGGSSQSSLILSSYWGGYKNEMTLMNGNVGIGTTNPVNKLHVAGAVSTNPSVLIQNDSYNSTNSSGAVSLQFGFANHGAAKIEAFKQTVNTTGLNFYTEYGYNVSQLAMSIRSTGNVGIGTADPDAKLAVNGTIHSKEVRVDLTNWPDYVFEKDYNLPSLDSIKTYIDQHKHLPEVPSAKEMEANGVNLGEMNMLLLKKIEELTLYVIEQNKIVERLQTRDEAQQKELDRLNTKN